jgi:predicted ferric reductase
MKIKVRVAQPWKYRPGQSVYVYFPTLLFGFWQSHPFSILACTKEVGEKVLEDVSSIEGPGESDGIEEDDKLFDIPLLQTDSSSDSEATYFHFLTKAQTGLTRRIRKTALSRDSYKLTAFIEGPYGISDSFDMFPSVLFISGGVAVTFTMSHLVQLLETKSRDPTARVQKVHHVWVIKEQDNIEWIQQELDRIAQLDLRKEFLKMSFYVSQMETGVSDGPNIGIGKSQIFPHRADIPEIISDAAQERLGTLAVVGLFH